MFFFCVCVFPVPFCLTSLVPFERCDMPGDEGYRYSDIEFQWRSPMLPLFQSFQWRSYWYGERIHGLSGISGVRCWPLPASWWLMFQSSPWSFSLSKGRHCFFVNAFRGKKSENIFDKKLPTAKLSWLPLSGLRNFPLWQWSIIRCARRDYKQLIFDEWIRFLK